MHVSAPTALLSTLLALTNLAFGALVQGPEAWHAFNLNYPPANLTVNVNDVVVINWSGNFSSGATFGLSYPYDNGSIETPVAENGSYPYTIASYTSYPYSATIGFSVTTGAAIYGVTQIVTATSNSAAGVTTYAATTTGTSVSLATSTATGAAAGFTGAGVAGFVGAAAAVAVLL